MISGVLFIVLAWVLTIPLWVSICLTIWGSVCIMASVVRLTLGFFRVALD